MILFFDTETSGLPRRWNAPVTDVSNWPRLVQLAWILTDSSGDELSRCSQLVKPDQWTISQGAFERHGISMAVADAQGLPVAEVVDAFCEDLDKASVVVGHNVSFDLAVVGAEILRQGRVNELMRKRSICTMRESTDYCRLPGKKGYKWPTLMELHSKLFGTEFEAAHDALADCEACMRCYFELKRKRYVA